MKSINMIIAALAIYMPVATAQTSTSEQGTTFGVRAGVNFQNINGKNAAGNTMENSLVTRFHVGVDAEIPVAPDFYFQPGLLFSTKGAKKEDVVLGTTITASINLYYLELPLHFIYKPLLGTGNLILGLGPYLAYGIGGKAKLEGNGTSIEQDIKFQSSVSSSDNTTAVYFKAFDAGADLFAGYEFSNKLSIRLNAQLGLVEINPSIDDATDNQSSFKNTGFGLSIGYRF